MHGAIIADYFRTPWIPVKISRKILDFKWHDWCESIDVQYEPVLLQPSDALEFLLNHKWPGSSRSTAASTKSDKTEKALPVGEVKTAHFMYPAIQRIRPLMRHVRRNAVLGAKTARNAWPASAWNERHAASLANQIRSLTRMNGYISEDALRQRKIDQLHTVCDRIRRDYEHLLS
jgi:succinoglycan biosynthesis protein ExoV